MNKIAITGRLTADPEIRTLTSGKTVANFAIAHNSQKDAPPQFFDCECWNQTAESLQHARKGSEISILGSLKQSTWTDSQTGKQRSRVMVIAWNVAHFSKPKSSKPTPQTKTHGESYANTPF